MTLIAKSHFSHLSAKPQGSVYRQRHAAVDRQQAERRCRDFVVIADAAVFIIRGVMFLIGNIERHTGWDLGVFRQGRILEQEDVASLIVRQRFRQTRVECAAAAGLISSLRGKFRADRHVIVDGHSVLRPIRKERTGGVHPAVELTAVFWQRRQRDGGSRFVASRTGDGAVSFVTVHRQRHFGIRGEGEIFHPGAILAAVRFCVFLVGKKDVSAYAFVCRYGDRTGLPADLAIIALTVRRKLTVGGIRRDLRPRADHQRIRIRLGHRVSGSALFFRLIGRRDLILKLQHTRTGDGDLQRGNAVIFTGVPRPQNAVRRSPGHFPAGLHGDALRVCIPRHRRVGIGICGEGASRDRQQQRCEQRRPAHPFPKPHLSHPLSFFSMGPLGGSTAPAQRSPLVCKIILRKSR